MPLPQVQMFTPISPLGLEGLDIAAFNYSRDGVFVTSPKNDGLNIAYKNTFVADNPR